MKQDLKQEAMLEIKAFKTQLYKSYRDHNENFEASVDDMIPFLTRLAYRTDTER